MTRTLIRAALMVLGSVALASCQLVYEITVSAKNGQLAFKTVSKRFGPDKPAAIERFEVTEQSQHPRTVWQIQSAMINGEDVTELFYGKLPKGFTQGVAPERLKVGQLYRATLWGLGGMDEAYFVIARYDVGRPITVLQSSSSS